MLRLSFETQKIKENYAIFSNKTAHFVPFLEKVQKKGLVEACRKTYLNN